VDSLYALYPGGGTDTLQNEIYQLAYRLALGHGHYLVGSLLNGPPGDYFGADGFVSGWHNRNIRIYSNVARLIRAPEQRALLVIGAGHVPIIRGLLASAPFVRLVDAADVLSH
jgi:hypothetical protein